MTRGGGRGAWGGGRGGGGPGGGNTGVRDLIEGVPVLEGTLGTTTWACDRPVCCCCGAGWGTGGDGDGGGGVFGGGGEGDLCCASILIFAKMAWEGEGRAAGGGVGTLGVAAQTWSASSSAGTGWPQLEHLTVDSIWETRSCLRGGANCAMAARDYRKKGASFVVKRTGKEEGRRRRRAGRERCRRRWWFEERINRGGNRVEGTWKPASKKQNTGAAETSAGISPLPRLYYHINHDISLAILPNIIISLIIVRRRRLSLRDRSPSRCVFGHSAANFHLTGDESVRHGIGCNLNKPSKEKHIAELSTKTFHQSNEFLPEIPIFPPSYPSLVRRRQLECYQRSKQQTVVCFLRISLENALSRLSSKEGPSLQEDRSRRWISRFRFRKGYLILSCSGPADARGLNIVCGSALFSS